jgi:hypothetical protein
MYSLLFLTLGIRSNTEIGVVPPVAIPWLVIRRGLLNQKKVSGQSDSADMTSVFLHGVLLHFGDLRNDYTGKGCMLCDGNSSFHISPSPGMCKMLRYALFYISFLFISVVVP